MNIPGRIDRCVLDKIELVLRAWRPAIGGRCSSVGSRLSTKQTYVYIGDADSATPASKYSPPWTLRRETLRRACTRAKNKTRTAGLDSSSRESCAWFLFLFFLFASFCLFCLSFVFFSPLSRSSFYPLLLLLFRLFHSSPRPSPCVPLVADGTAVLFFVVATCQSKASHTSYRLVVS